MAQILVRSLDDALVARLKQRAKLNRRSLQIAVELLQLALEFLEQGERVRGRSGKSGNDFIVMKLAHFASAALHDGLAQANLPVTDDDNLAAVAERQNSGPVDHIDS